MQMAVMPVVADMLNKEFMGLIMLAPGDKQPDGATELWINIG